MKNQERNLLPIMKLRAHSTARDMTEGSILRQMILFALPLMLGNVFQMLYNTVDSVIVGNFVSKQALAAIGRCHRAVFRCPGYGQAPPGH